LNNVVARLHRQYYPCRHLSVSQLLPSPLHRSQLLICMPRPYPRLRQHPFSAKPLFSSQPGSPSRKKNSPTCPQPPTIDIDVPRSPPSRRQLREMLSKVQELIPEAISCDDLNQNSRPEKNCRNRITWRADHYMKRFSELNNRHVKSPSENAMLGLKRLVRYLPKTRHATLLFPSKGLFLGARVRGQDMTLPSVPQNSH